MKTKKYLSYDDVADLLVQGVANSTKPMREDIDNLKRRVAMLEQKTAAITAVKTAYAACTKEEDTVAAWCPPSKPPAKPCWFCRWLGRK